MVGETAPVFSSDLIRKLLPQVTVFLAGDDTLLNRRGLKMFGAGMHRDPLLSSRGPHLFLHERSQNAQL